MTRFLVFYNIILYINILFRFLRDGIGDNRRDNITSIYQEIGKNEPQLPELHLVIHNHNNHI